MKRILIADASKASLVMTCELFKENYPGVQVMVARNSVDALEIAKNDNTIDAIILDYDLPDNNGAQTALLLKKFCKIPVLITAFERDDVSHTIETVLAKYDDCKSWLKKPVNPEVLMAVTQRYCEGKIRSQKRVDCQISILVTVQALVPKAPKKTKTAEKPVAKPAPALSFHAILEDCSLNGVKIKPVQHAKNGKTSWAALLKKIEQLPEGSGVTLNLPSMHDIETSKLRDISSDNLQQEITGKVIWTSSESGEWCMGIEFGDTIVSKKLFEVVVASHGKHNKARPSQALFKLNRAG